MKIVVTGYSGQLGYDVVREGLRRGMTMTGTTSRELDVTDEAAVRRFIMQHQPDAIIHCAAYTAVDQAEDDPDTCRKVNVEGTVYLAQVAKDIQAKLLYVSTDYVFNGEGVEPFTEADHPDPISTYGRTKLEGEQAVQSLVDRAFIVRISWVFGINGKNFVRTMLRLSEACDHLQVVNDQIGSPTYTVDAARFLIDLILTDHYGIYHATNEGYCSWADFAAEIFRQAGKQVQVTGIPSEQYPTRATRPKNSRLSKRKLEAQGFKPLPSWQDALRRYLVELAGEPRK